MEKTQKYSNEDEIQAVSKIISGSGVSLDLNFTLNKLKDEGWEIHPIYFDLKVIGGIIQKDAEIHTSVSPEFQKKWNPRPYINNILYPALDKYKKIKSLSLKSDQDCLKWLIKLGFEIIEEDENYFYLELKKIKFRR